MNKAKFFGISMVAVWVIVITWLAYSLNGGLYGIDDADIFFTYAENLAKGSGILYSQGIPPVEGYTSTLWMLLSSIMFFTGLNEVGVLLISLLLFGSTHMLVFRILEIVVVKENHFLSKLSYVGIVSASFGYISWTTVTLMDTTLWSFLIVSMTYFLLFDPKTKAGWGIASIPFVLAPFVRPEAFLVAPIVLFLLLVKLREKKLHLAPAFCIFLGFIVSVTALTAFRLLYFGYPLPNTFYAKVSPSLTHNIQEGLRYLINFTTSSVLVSLGFILACIFVLNYFSKLASLIYKKSRPKQHFDNINIVGLVSLVILVCIGLPILTGGDHFRLFRFYQPVYPLISLLLVATLFQYTTVNTIKGSSGFLEDSKWLRGGVLLVFAIWLATLSATDSWFRVAVTNYSPIAHEFQIAKTGRERGVTMNDLFSLCKHDMPAIGVIAAGGIARTYNGPIYDLMGPNNAYIAHFPGNRVGYKNHSAFEKEAFFDLPVALLIASPISEFYEMVLKGLFNDERFLSNWRYGFLYKTGEPCRRFEAFYKNEFIDDVLMEGEYYFIDTMLYKVEEAKWEPVDYDFSQASCSRFDHRLTTLQGNTRMVELTPTGMRATANHCGPGIQRNQPMAPQQGRRRLTPSAKPGDRGSGFPLGEQGYGRM